MGLVLGTSAGSAFILNRGYIKLWRKSIESGWLKNPQLWAFWCWCLLKASSSPHDFVVGFQKVHLEAGDFIFGRRTAAEELKTTEQKIRTCLDALQKLKNVTIKTTNKFSIISIVNWDVYQPNKNENNQQTNQQVTNKQPTSNHKQECKEVKKRYISPELIELSANFLRFQQNAFPEIVKDIGENKIKNGALTVQRLIEIDGYDLEKQIRPALKWAVKDEFWRDKVLCLSGLRIKGKNGEKKFANILMAMCKNGTAKFETIEDRAARAI
jgi:hypothetical protein